MARLVSLFSGSRGNCTLVSHHNTNILVDAGLNSHNIAGLLTTVELSPTDIDAIVITHEHIDHISSLSGWRSAYNTPIYVHESIAQYVADKCQLRDLSTFGDNAFSVGQLNIETIECSHDALHCCGFRFDDGVNKTAVVTDTGVVTQRLIDSLAPCRTVMIESNHDISMLSRGSYPYLLKKRILSSVGHLSNNQTSVIIDNLLEGNTFNIILAHLSQNNNTQELAFACAMQAIYNKRRIEGKDIRLFVANQHARSEVIE